MDCVADLSFTSGWFQPAQSHLEGVRLLKQHLAGEVKLACPSIWIYEVLNLLASGVRRGRLTEAQADDALELLNSLEVTIEEPHPDTVLRRVHRFARQFKLTAYDAAYLELADRLQVPLLTRDDELITAAKQRGLSLTLPK